MKVDVSKFSLVPDGSGNVDLQFEHYYVITLYPDGTFRRVQKVGTATGLKLDRSGRIVEVKDGPTKRSR